MSLNSFKEILKPCHQSQSQSSSASASVSAYSQTSTTLNARKPPKSSLSQQLLRLEDDSNSFPTLLSTKQSKEVSQRKQQPHRTDVVVEREFEDEEEEFKEEGKGNGFRIAKPKLDAPQFFHPTGPYEPLVLSGSGHNPVVQVPASINCRLLEHQREGVKFLYNLYKKNHGGILGDDMGLGKTIQAIAFLSAVYGKDGEYGETTILKGNEGDKKGPVLIICPSSVIQNWEAEFYKWATFSVAIYHGTNRDMTFEKIEAHGVEILITSFDTYRIHGNILSSVSWEIVIVDEAHRLKNEKSKLYEACLAIKTRKRYGLTGTVMQNKIMELFNLFDWVVPGGLGTREHFRDYYDEPLKHGQRSSAPERFVQVAQERKKHLVSVLNKFLLRRTKEETIGHLMKGKEDNVIFCAMSEVQKRVYRRMLQLPDIQCLIDKDLPCSCGSPLKQVECCKRTVPNGVIWPYLHKDNPDGCDSCPFCLVLPCLTKLQQISNHLELIKPNPRDDSDKQRKDKDFASAVFGTDIDLVGGYTQNESFMGLSDVQHCGKMRALENLMSSWILEGDKILLFSFSVRMLDILEKFHIRKGYSFSRLDGSTPTSLRQSLVDDFNSSPSKQAQDRSFRFGQKRHVVVFRLLAAGSLEELVYTRQVYKQQLANIAVSGKLEKRYFEGVQDCKEFQGELFGISNLFRDLSDKLFTSEIIEPHDKQGTEQERISGEKQSLPDFGMCFLPQQARETFSLDSESSKPFDDKSSKRIVPVNGELGIVYAHRNEDIISHGRECDAKQEVTTSTLIQPCFPQKPTVLSEKGNGSLRTHKMKQYRMVAKFMGMEVVEFSKWVLSASVLERKRVLRDYKRRNYLRCGRV
ncbi:switch 2 isoform X2 [Cynara cardunculus var. scolymus]|uniref:switch 2 isoform X2 n=1 Tax=Cynara cardunculus var. scolymus TaxID=59895 RepID=UPI000D629EC4|nr:switch 2 isoform X2 [Cynara cardunculus var. scolymus]